MRHESITLLCNIYRKFYKQKSSCEIQYKDNEIRQSV